MPKGTPVAVGVQEEPGSVRKDIGEVLVANMETCLAATRQHEYQPKYAF
jgi:hypothetical protein